MIKSKFIDNYYSIKKFNDDLFKFTYLKYRKNNLNYRIDKNIKVERNKNERKLNNNMSRARTKIFELATCNDFDYFVTLTLDKNKYDRYNLEKYIKDLGQFIRDYRKKYKVDIQYLLIPELHKDGAYHMHGLIKNLPNEHFIINNQGYLDWPFYSDKFGYCSLGYIQNKLACAKYITKYISKSFSTNVAVAKNKKLYYNSRGLKTSLKIKEGIISANITPPNDFENDYIITAMLDKKKYNELIELLD